MKAQRLQNNRFIACTLSAEGTVRNKATEVHVDSLCLQNKGSHTQGTLGESPPGLLRNVLFVCLMFVSLTRSSLAFAASKPEPTYKLSLQQALAMLLQRNPALAREKLTLKQAQADIVRAKGAFGLDLNSDLRLSRSLLPADLQLNSSSLGTTNTNLTLGRLQVNGNLSLVKKLPTGTKVSLSLDNSWTQQDRLDLQAFLQKNSNAVFNNNSASTSLSLELTQPLLRGAWLPTNTAPIKQAEEKAKMAQYQLKAFVLQKISETTRVYWDLVYAKRNQSIKQNALKLAQQQLANTLQLIKAGKVAALEKYQVQQAVAKRKEELLTAEQDVQAKENQLAILLFLPKQSTLTPTEATTDNGMEDNLDDLLKWAKKNHPSVKSAFSESQIAKLAALVSKNGTLPQLDVVAGFSFVGFGRDEGQSGNAASPLGTAYASMFDPKSHNFYVGVKLTVALDNREAVSKHQRNKYEVERTILRIKELLRKLDLEIQQRYRNVEQTHKRIKLAQSSLVWAQKKLEAERSKFKVGRSTLFQILQFQQDLADAQRSVLRAKIDYRKAVVALYEQVGSLPQRFGISKRI